MKARILFIAASVAVLAGCPDDDDDYYRYDVSVTNRQAIAKPDTAFQPKYSSPKNQF